MIIIDNIIPKDKKNYNLHVNLFIKAITRRKNKEKKVKKDINSMKKEVLKKDIQPKENT